MRANIQRIKKISGRKFLLMVKADAYGHGIPGLVPRIADEVDAFGVADTREALCLADYAKGKPILITGDYENPHTVVEHGFTPFVFLKRHIEELSAEASRARKTVRVHIKVDSGMSRFGVNNPDYSRELAAMCVRQGSVRLTGIGTHYASCNTASIIEHNRQFARHITQAEAAAGRLLRHAASTSPVLTVGGAYDMLRIGIGAYGYGEGLIPAMKVKSAIIAVRMLREGASAGYGGVYRADRLTRIAVVAGGYADGISRAYIGLSVRIRGMLHRIVAVCMDNFLVALDGYCAAGDEVEVLFRGNDAGDIASKINTIPYEVLTAFRGRIKRIYNDRERGIKKED